MQRMGRNVRDEERESTGAGARRPPLRRTVRAASRVALVACVALWTTATAGERATAGIEEARTMLEKWVETRRVITKEKTDWQLGAEMLTERVKLLLREIGGLRDRIAEANASIADADAKRAALVEENERAKQRSVAFASAVSALETRTKALLARLPDPIRERVRPLSQRLPEDPAGTTLPLSQRFQNVVGILNEVDKFHREITVTSEVRALGDGRQAEVATMYVGLGQAFYASTAADAAGVGSAAADGWRWTSSDSSAAEIARAIAILKNEQVADFVPLPIRID